MVFCEEVSQRRLKTIYVKVDMNNMCNYGFNKNIAEPKLEIL